MKCNFQKYASAGNRTRAARVAGEHSTTEPPMLTFLWGIYICYMTGENPVSWLAQSVFINLYVYLETGLNQSTS